MLRKKIQNMGLTTDHFYMQKPKISDDDFKTIIKESYSMYQIMRTFKHKNVEGSKKNILKRIENLDIDISHFKKRQIRTKSGGKLAAIDDETFKTMVKDNRTWGDLTVACGFRSYGGTQLVMSRIEKLGLSTNHYNRKTAAPTASPSASPWPGTPPARPARRARTSCSDKSYTPSPPTSSPLLLKRTRTPLRHLAPQPDQHACDVLLFGGIAIVF